MRRHPKGSRRGGQFAADWNGKTPPTPQFSSPTTPPAAEQTNPAYTMGTFHFATDLAAAQRVEAIACGIMSSPAIAQLPHGTTTIGNISIISHPLTLGHLYGFVPAGNETTRMNDWLIQIRQNTTNPTQLKETFKTILSSPTPCHLAPTGLIDPADVAKHTSQKGGSDIIDVTRFPVCQNMGLAGDCEVKSDMAAQRYGNLYFENQQNARNLGIWRPSGLSTTEATVWFHAAGTPSRTLLIYVLRTNDLRRHINEAKPSTGYTAGDNPTKGWLLPAHTITH